MNIDFFNSVKVVSGKDCFKNYGEFEKFGKKAVIVCGKNSARLCGALAHAEEGLSAAGIEYCIFDRVEPNPLVSTCHEGGRIARDFGADFVIGIGGGSPLDAAKAVAAFAANPDFAPEDIYTKVRVPALPLLAVNTTAGTGSEVTPYSIMTVPSLENKKSFAGDDLYAKVAFLDPSYTLSLPVNQTYSTAVDALCHAVEGYFMKKANPVSDALAEKCIPMLCSGMRKVLAGDLGYETREELLYASSIAGMVISRTGTGFVHSTGYMLTYFHGLSHGHANAYFLADFVGFMAKENPERAGKIFALCGVKDAEELWAFLGACPDMPLSPVFDVELADKYAARTITVKNVGNAVSVITEPELRDILRRRCT
ncbi:MAG: iron-containing alcohol dehydrogenase [Clostridia bacterium]|nr:iron-containing alcohol dehydrogenase [Clostridia bacterium]